MKAKKVKPKTNRQILNEEIKLVYPDIEGLVGKHGFDVVRLATQRWLNYNKEKARLMRRKNELAEELQEIESALQ